MNRRARLGTAFLCLAATASAGCVTSGCTYTGIVDGLDPAAWSDAVDGMSDGGATTRTEPSTGRPFEVDDLRRQWGSVQVEVAYLRVADGHHTLRIDPDHTVTLRRPEPPDVRRTAASDLFREGLADLLPGGDVGSWASAFEATRTHERGTDHVYTYRFHVPARIDLEAWYGAHDFEGPSPAPDVGTVAFYGDVGDLYLAVPVVEAVPAAVPEARFVVDALGHFQLRIEGAGDVMEAEQAARDTWPLVAATWDWPHYLGDPSYKTRPSGGCLGGPS